MNLQSSSSLYTNGNIIPFLNGYDKIYQDTSRLCHELNLGFEELIQLQKQVSYLRDNGHIISHITFSDLDDTLLSRVPQLEEDKFANARGHAGNEVVASMGLKNFVNQYYSPELVVQSISKITDVILTAGEIDNQEAKIQKSNLCGFDTIIVPKHSLKAKELLYFLLFKLKKIPQFISFFDDRITEIEPQLSSISEFLNNSILCHKVKLNVDFPNQVKKIDTNIYSSGILFNNSIKNLH